MIDDKYNTISPRLKSVRAFIRSLFGSVFTQIYRALYGEAMLVPPGRTQTWRPENNRHICP